MSRSIVSRIGSGLAYAWRALDFGRRAILNVLFLIVLVVIAIAFFTGGPKPLGAKTMLVLDLKGELVEPVSYTHLTLPTICSV